MTLTFLTSVVTAWVSPLSGPKVGRDDSEQTLHLRASSGCVSEIAPSRRRRHEDTGSPINNLCRLKESGACPDFNAPEHALECSCKSEYQQGAGGGMPQIFVCKDVEM